jgi:mannonate dehydratase
MDRRRFFSVTSAGAAAAASAALPGAAQPRHYPAAPGEACKSARLPPLKARLGHQMNGALTEDNARWASRYGLDAICARPEIKDPDRLYPNKEELTRMLDLADKHKLKVEMIDTIMLGSVYVDKEKHDAIMLGQSPERDHEIEAIQNTLRNCAEVGIRCYKYNMNLLGVPRTGTVPGRGDTVYNKWNLREALAENRPLTRAGHVSESEYWDRIEYFLARVVPVANETRVRIACHPEDPAQPPEGFQGIQNPLCTIDGLKKFVQLHESPYHGLNFCQGTISETLYHPSEELADVIRWFGSRKKIFNVHFRNITGGRYNFVAEMFPDEGDVDFVKALKVYREVGYEDLLMPDHAPRVVAGDEIRGLDPEQVKVITQRTADRGSRENFAYEFGYIRGLIQAEQHLV